MKYEMPGPTGRMHMYRAILRPWKSHIQGKTNLSYTTQSLLLPKLIMFSEDTNFNDWSLPITPHFRTAETAEKLELPSLLILGEIMMEASRDSTPNVV